MTEGTDRALAAIDEAIDGYVSEDWHVSGDAMRWQPEEPEQSGKWIAPGEGWIQSDQVRVGEELLRTMAERLARLFENMRCAEAGVFVQRYVAGLSEAADDGPARQETYAGWSDVWQQAFEGAWCTSVWVDELRVEAYRPGNPAGIEPHWDDSLVASLDRIRERQPERAALASSPVLVTRTSEAIEEALRSQSEPDVEPLTVNWKVDAGHVSRRRRKTW